MSDSNSLCHTMFHRVAGGWEALGRGMQTVGAGGVRARQRCSRRAEAEWQRSRQATHSAVERTQVSGLAFDRCLPFSK